ncbi:MAG: MFS transporter [Gaiellales bacterium]
MTTATAPAERTRYRDALAVGEFRTLYAAFVISVIGSVVAAVALTVLVYQRTASPFLSSLTFALGFVPFLVSGTLLSALVDRLPLRRLMVGCDLLAAVLAGAMAIPSMPVAALLVLLLLLGTVSGVSGGARSALLPTLLPPAAYVAGTSLFRVSAQLAQIVGNGVGGVLLVVLSPRGAIVVDAISFAASAALIRAGVRAREARTELPDRPSLLRDSLAGVGAVLAHKQIRRLLLFGWLVPTCAVAPEALAAPYVTGLGGSSAMIGWWLVALPVGMALGDALGIWLLSTRAQRRFTDAFAAWGFVPYLAFVAHPGFGPGIALLGTAGLGAAYTLGYSALLLEATEGALRSRALAIASAGLMFLQGLGFATAGAAAEIVDPHLVIAVAGGLGLAVVGLLRPRVAGEARLPSY